MNTARRPSRGSEDRIARRALSMILRLNRRFGLVVRRTGPLRYAVSTSAGTPCSVLRIADGGLYETPLKGRETLRKDWMQRARNPAPFR